MVTRNYLPRFIVFIFISFISFCTVAVPEEVERLASTQAERLESPHALDVMIFPSHVEFEDVEAKWGGAAGATRTLKLTVFPVVITVAPEKTSVKLLSADITTDGGKSWRTVDFESIKENGVWEALLDFPEWSVKESVLPETSTATAKPTPVPASTNKKRHVIVCFRAEDSLGNVTVELPHQNAPQAERDVHFTPLVTDSAALERTMPEPDFSLSPDRDILETYGAWLRNQLFFRMHIAGTTVKGRFAPPSYNYYIIRFIPLDTPSFNCQLGSGIYQYYSLIPKSNKIFQSQINEGAPFRLEYDPMNLYHLAALIHEAKDTPNLPSIFEEYKALLGEAGLSDILNGNIPVPGRQTIENTGLTARHLMDRIYWKINLDTFKEDEGPTRGLRVRFYTGFIRTKDSSGVARDDWTAYTTILLNQRKFNEGKNKEIITTNEPVQEMPRAPEMDPAMKELFLRNKPR